MNIIQFIQLTQRNYIKIRVCELGLEYGVWGMESNSKLGVYKQEWHYQAGLIFNSNLNVYY